MMTVATRLRIAGIGGLVLVVVAAAARPLHHQMSGSEGAKTIAYVLPAALVPALLVRYALARRWVMLMAVIAVAFAAVSALGFAGALVPVKPVAPKHRLGGAADSNSSGDNTTGLLTKHGGGTHTSMHVSGTL